MNRSRLIGIAIIALFFTSCKKETYTEEIIINDDQSELNKRISHTNAGLISIQSTDSTQQKTAFKTNSVNDDFSLAIVAEIDPPEFEDFTLRATHVTVQNSYAYITYNTEGNIYLGGIDVLDISDINNPRLVNSAQVTDVDLSSVAIDGNVLLLAGAGDLATNPQLQDPAWAADMQLNNGLLTRQYEYIGVPSFVGTDVAVFSETTYFVTSGDNGGLSKIVIGTDQVDTTIFIDDLRAVSVRNDQIFTLSGESGIRIYSSNLEELATFSTNIDVPASKRTIDFYDSYVLVAEGLNGLGIYNANSGEEVSQIPIPDLQIEGITVDTQDKVTNAVSVNEGKIFTANGGAGLAIYTIEPEAEISLLGGTMFPNSEQSSTNYVMSEEDYVFIASGKGGLKILKMTDLTESEEVQCNGDYGEFSGSTNSLNINGGQSQSYDDEITFSGNANINASLNWCGSLDINGNRINVNGGGTFNMFGTLDAQRDISVNGTMSTTGTTLVGRNISINGGGTLTVNGSMTQGESGSNSRVTINGELVIDGEVIFYGDLTVNGGGRIRFLNNESSLTVYGDVNNRGSVQGGTIIEI